MLDTEKEACLILGEVAATLSLAYNLVKKERSKQLLPTLQNELLAVRSEIETSAHEFDLARLSSLMAESNIGTENSKSATKLASNVGSAALRLACAFVRHASLKVGSANPWGVNKLALDGLIQLGDMLSALAAYEESSSKGEST